MCISISGMKLIFLVMLLGKSGEVTLNIFYKYFPSNFKNRNVESMSNYP